ncbi:hypothetical protein C9374_003566 [Naegleria lovaniensis]|uniref:DUF4116 domain-containing protein n=1 Tax=Naegleria lovaniensis TaxID=51637 RepID=A0AA88KS51_NAELO|nr:uncharacterized protein C9374_003566 [Naegleria lovaniensis]KAG2393802.1 hypothetical protein C9374_003566 [Naegleria lovaniensis]
MKRKLSHHHVDHHCPLAPVTKYSKQSKTTQVVKIILIDFHGSVSDAVPMIESYSSHVHQLFEHLKRKFENQSKGYSKWLQAKLERMIDNSLLCIYTNDDKNDLETMIEFMNDPYCVMQLLHHCDDMECFPMIWMMQPIDVSELCEQNQELIGTVEFWRPFKMGILNLLKNKKFQVLKYIPKEILFEWMDDLKPIFIKHYNFSFIFEVDDADEAKKVLCEDGCYLFQLSDRLRDNEEIVKHAINAKHVNLYMASERLQHDFAFLLSVVRSNPETFSKIPQEFRNDKEFVLELLNTSMTSLDGTIEQDLIQTCIPEVYVWVPQSVRDEIPMEIIMKVYQQLFLKDEAGDFMKNELLRSVIQMLCELPDEYYQAHQKYQRNLTEQGCFVHSLFDKCHIHHIIQQDEEFANIVEQVMTRLYKGYDQIWIEQEEAFVWKRKDLELIMKYGPLTLRKNRNFVVQAATKNVKSFKNALSEFQHDRQIILTVLHNRGDLLNELQDFFIPQMLHDKEMVLTALKSEHPCAFSKLPAHLQDDRDCALAALSNTKIPNVRVPIQTFIKRKDVEVINAGLKRSEIWMAFLPDDFKSNRDFVLKSLHYPGGVFVLDFISEELKQDANFILECVKQNPPNLEFLFSLFSIELLVLNSEIISEYMKRCGILSRRIMGHVCKTFFDEHEESNDDDFIQWMTSLQNQRMEYEYLGCYIPESRLMKEPITLLEVEDEGNLLECSFTRAYDKWKEYLLGNATWEIFFKKY